MASNWLRNRPLVYNPQSAVAKPVKRFEIGRILWGAIKRACMVLGAVMMISILFTVISLSRMPAVEPVVLPDTMVLNFNLMDGIKNRAGANEYLAELGLAPAEITLPQLISALDRGANDKRVKGFVLTLNSGAYGLTQIEDLRDAVKRFKVAGKFTAIYAASYGDIGTGLGAYYLASAFDKIYMQPVGMVTIAGIYAQSPYFRGLFDRLGIEPEFFGRKEYKTAMENLSSKSMSAPSREMMQSVVNSIGDTIARDIARDRVAVGGNFRSLMNKGLFTDDEALQTKLIDHLNYEDEMRREIKQTVLGKDAGDKKLFASVEAYLAEPQHKTTAGKMTAAHIYIAGAIIDHMEGGGYQFQDRVADAKNISKDILDAAKNKDVKALVLQVNSPGGSPTASETIRRAIVLAKTTYNKPVYVVMGDAAASGGYWLSADATKIYARPTTFTGSIGVVGGKMNIAKLSQNYDVNWDGVQYGDNAGLFAINKKFSASEQERYEATLDNIYAHFTARVAAGRHLKPEQVEQIARGRVWTGAQAKEIGLVDALGGMDLAMNDLAKTLGGQTKHDVELVDWPREKSPLDAFKAMFEGLSPLGGIGGKILTWLGFDPEVMGVTPRALTYEPEWKISF